GNDGLECRQWLPDGDVLAGGVGGCCREAGARFWHLSLRQHAPATGAQPSSHARRVDALTDRSVTESKAAFIHTAPRRSAWRIYSYIGIYEFRLLPRHRRGLRLSRRPGPSEARVLSH